MAAPEIHTITRWKVTGKTSYNNLTYGSGEEVIAFWIDDSRFYTGANGDDFLSKSRILCNSKLFEEGDRVQFSPLASSDFDKSFIVRRTEFVENRFQTTQLHTAILSTTS